MGSASKVGALEALEALDGLRDLPADCLKSAVWDLEETSFGGSPR